MPFTIVRDDITHVKVDAIVNAANSDLLMGGGVCGAIFRAAGSRKLQAACDKIGHCDTGQAVATPAFALPARHVIHTVGPIWHGGTQGERDLLASCYRTSLELAASLKCSSIAFPLISAGIYGYPKREALEVAQAQIRSFLETHEMDVRLVLFDARVMELADDLRLRVKRYIDDVYVDASGYSARRPWENVPSFADTSVAEDASLFGSAEDSMSFSEPMESYAMPAPPAAAPSASAAPSAAPRGSKRRERQKLPGTLRNLLSHLDAGFSETLLAMIDERDLKDAQVYKRANLSRQHFSKIRSNPLYRPTKQTVLALAVALELSLDETQLLLQRAGFALSHADRRDVIVEFFIREGIYDVFQINEALFAFDQPLLG
jgi:O-acetyl-ADP-ribose deacetylase (regulator of RNase III)